MAADPIIGEMATRLRATGILGRSEPLRKLFDFLVARSGDATAPKEVEAAAAIFGASADFDVSQDASVRVYIHRLRQKLDEYYAGPGRGDGDRLSIPKGTGYRLIAEPIAVDGQAEAMKPKLIAWTLPWMVATAAIVMALAAITLLWVNRPAANADALAAVRQHAPWSRLLADDRPITVVVGDYYIFGEIGTNGTNDRLVRDYTINSPSDLDAYLMQHPAQAYQFMDLDLYYLPVSTAFALRNILPILSARAADRDRIHIVQASDLTPDMIKRTNIVYVGYLSGLGLLREPVFLGSRFSVGTTYDELIDNVGKHRYLSQEGEPDHGGRKLKDYGYFSTFDGPNGNHIVIVAGTRDIAVMQTSEALADSRELASMMAMTGTDSSFEALYEVEGLKRINLGGRLLLASPLNTDRIWNGQPSGLRFPDG